MARNFATKEGAKVQEYCMYFKLLQRTFGGKVPPDAADAFNQCFPCFLYVAFARKMCYD
ncbi:MAG: hypothetical protein LUD69_08360 [Oscillospiraceae bacterium]|nr:hypothetical protein [Oscillospiraceae bacterium]